MPNDKFLRGFNKPGPEAYLGSGYYFMQSLYPAIFPNYTFVPNGFHDVWYKVRFRLRIDTDYWLQTNNLDEYYPYFWFIFFAGRTGFELEFEKEFIFESYYLNNNGQGILYNTTGSLFAPPPGRKRFYDYSGITTTFGETLPVASPSLANFFNRINELVIHQRVESGILTSKVYFGEATGTGSIPQMAEIIATGSAVTSTYSDSFSVQIYVNQPYYTEPDIDVRNKLFSESSFDIFQIEFGSGLLPPGFLDSNAPLIVSGGNYGGYGSDFTEFANTADFINKVRPRTSYRDSEHFVFFEGYFDGWYAPLFQNTGPDHSCNEQLAMKNSYVSSSEAYYFDYQLYKQTLASEFPSFPLAYLPYDDYLASPYFELYPTGSSAFRMMGPLEVAGSISPPPSQSVTLNLGPVHLKYALVQAPSIRRGVFVQESSGSPHLSLEPVWPTSSWHLPGDVWFSNTTGSWRGLFYADYESPFNIESAPTTSIVPYKIFATTGSRTEIDGGTY